MIVKQKTQACAAFLGVPAFSGNVVSVCCIPTTNLMARNPAKLCKGEVVAAAGPLPLRVFRESTSP
jgi:hypothetical protein